MRTLFGWVGEVKSSRAPCCKKNFGLGVVYNNGHVACSMQSNISFTAATEAREQQKKTSPAISLSMSYGQPLVIDMRRLIGEVRANMGKRLKTLAVKQMN